METRATYKEIIQSVVTFDGFEPKTCWVSDVLAAHGLTDRVAPNRKGEDRVEPCPDRAWEPIVRALRRKGIIQDSWWELPTAVTRRLAKIEDARKGTQPPGVARPKGRLP